MRTIELVVAEYEYGFTELEVRLTRGAEKPLILNGHSYSIEDAEDIVEILIFGLKRLKEAGIVKPEKKKELSPKEEFEKEFPNEKIDEKLFDLVGVVKEKKDV